MKSPVKGSGPDPKCQEPQQPLLPALRTCLLSPAPIQPPSLSPRPGRVGSSASPLSVTSLLFPGLLRASCFPQVGAHTDTHNHAHSHVLIHTHSCTHACTGIYTRACALNPCAHTHLHTRVKTQYRHTGTLAPTQPRAPHTYTWIHTHRHTHELQPREVRCRHPRAVWAGRAGQVSAMTLG